MNGTIRLVVENYQPIHETLYGGLQIFVEDDKWKDYIVNVSIVKGRKAYIEFLPGILNMQTLTQGKDDYVEIAYVVAFNGEKPDLKALHQTQSDSKAIALRQKDQFVAAYDKMVSSLYDSSNFIGVAKGEPVFSPIFIRVDFKNPGQKKIAHHFLSTIEAGPVDFPQDGRGRLAWAQSVVDPKNPLTARIMVNRIWHYLFGKGLVETVDNFGVQGKLPSHPELLDFLALKFVADNWSIKKAIRHMAMSRAFRRTTSPDTLNLKIDAENIYLAHYPVRRLEAEALRDGVLAASGRLDTAFFGQSVPIDYNPFLSSFEKDILPKGVPKDFGPLDGDGRRSIYQMVRRNFINPMMTTFDTPIPSATVGQRTVLYTPAQSLTLLNDPFFHEQANFWAGQIVMDSTSLTTGSEWDSIKEIVREIYLRAFSRFPSDPEMKDALQFLKGQANEYGLNINDIKSDERLWTDYCHSIINMKEFIHLL